MLIVLLCGHDKFSTYPAQICNMHVTHTQFSEKFKNGWKQFEVVDLLWFFTFYFNNFTLWARFNFKSFSCIPLKFVLHAANNQFSDNLNNGGGLLSSVLLFQMIFTFKLWLEAEAYFRRRRSLLRWYYWVK